MCGVHYFIHQGKLLGLHQRLKNTSYITQAKAESREIGPLFEKIEIKASTWASSSSSVREAQPREFSYADLTRPIEDSGRTWLESEIEKSYPFMSYIIHLKTASICCIGGLLISLAIVCRQIILIRLKIQRVEARLAEGHSMHRMYKI